MRVLRLYAPAIALVVWALIFTVCDTELAVFSAVVTIVGAVKVHASEAARRNRRWF